MAYKQSQEITDILDSINRATVGADTDYNLVHAVLRQFVECYGYPLMVDMLAEHRNHREILAAQAAEQRAQRNT